MKKTWHRKRNIRIPLWSVIPPLALLLVWVLALGARAVFPNIFEHIAAQSLEVRGHVLAPIASVGAQFSNKEKLLDEIQKLEAELAAVQYELIVRDNLEAENRTLRMQLDVQDPDGILGAVIAWPPHTAYDVLLVSLPHEGVGEGWLVLGRGLAPIGYVERVVGSYAYVRLLTSAEQQTPVRVGVDAYPATMQGLGGGAAVVEVAKSLPVEEGDPLFFPYQGNRYLASVGHIETDDASPTKRLWVSFERHVYAEAWVSLVPYSIAL